MNPLWGHVVGVIIVMLMLIVHRHLDLGMAAVSQAKVRRPGADSTAR